MDLEDQPEPPLLDPECLTSFAPWQEALARRILGAPKGARVMVLMPRQRGRSALSRLLGRES